MSEIPENVRHLTPDFDTSKYEYAPGPAEEWENCPCEFWSHSIRIWVTGAHDVSFRSMHNTIYRRLKPRYLSIEPEEARKGDEKLSFDSSFGRKWVLYDPVVHIRTTGCAFRRRIEE